MSAGDRWSAFEDAPAGDIPEDVSESHSGDRSSPEPSRFEEDTEARRDKLAFLAEQLSEIDDALEFHKEARKRCLIEMKPLISPDEPQPIEAAEGWKLQVEQGERWSWDRDKLRELVEDYTGGEVEAPLPDFVDRDVKIDRKLYEAADADLRAHFAPALTIKPGLLKVTVWRNANEED